MGMGLWDTWYKFSTRLLIPACISCYMNLFCVGAAESRNLVTRAYHDDSDIEYDDSCESEEDLMFIDSIKK